MALAFEPALMAGLPAKRAWVKVGPTVVGQRSEHRVDGAVVHAADEVAHRAGRSNWSFDQGCAFIISDETVGNRDTTVGGSDGQVGVSPIVRVGVSAMIVLLIVSVSLPSEAEKPSPPPSPLLLLLKDGAVGQRYIP